jgi:hypothetical protein
VGRQAVGAAFGPFFEKHRFTQSFEILERGVGTDWCLLTAGIQPLAP